VCCGVLVCVAGCCSVCSSVCSMCCVESLVLCVDFVRATRDMTAVCCNVLQYVAVCCSMLQCVVCCFCKVYA